MEIGKLIAQTIPATLVGASVGAALGYFYVGTASVIAATAAIFAAVFAAHRVLGAIAKTCELPQAYLLGGASSAITLGAMVVAHTSLGIFPPLGMSLIGIFLGYSTFKSFLDADIAVNAKAKAA